MKRTGGILVLIGVFLLIGLVGVQHARQQPGQPAQQPAHPHLVPHPHTTPEQRAMEADEIELPLLEAVRDMLDGVDGDLDEDVDVDELREMLDEVEAPWRHAKADMHRGIREANRKFRRTHQEPPQSP